MTVIGTPWWPVRNREGTPGLNLVLVPLSIALGEDRTGSNSVDSHPAGADGCTIKLRTTPSGLLNATNWPERLQ